MSLASMTTLGVGGAASLLVTPMTEAEVVDVVRETAAGGHALHVLGGGSNVLIADAGLHGVVMRSADYAIDFAPERDYATVTVGAGVEWDELVEFCVTERLAGIECLSGIPGKVGAAPIQNIGAYGQEVSSVVASVRTVDRQTGATEQMPAGACGFGYRTSVFKAELRDRRVVTSVTLRLRRGGPPTVAYPELARALDIRPDGPVPPLDRVRDAVLRIRASKSMIYDRRDPNHRSAGSFFVNPTVTDDVADEVAARADGAGIDATAMPRFEVDGGAKLSAAWLIERAGFPRGFAFGAAGLSTNHCLAIVNRGSARASDIVALAAIVRRGVRTTFGITLQPEPVFMGFDRDVDELLG